MNVKLLAYQLLGLAAVALLAIAVVVSDRRFIYPESSYPADPSYLFGVSNAADCPVSEMKGMDKCTYVKENPEECEIDDGIFPYLLGHQCRHIGP